MIASFLRQSWLVLALAVGAGVGLAAVEQSLSGRIDKNIQRKSEQAACEVVGADPAKAEVKRIPDGPLPLWCVAVDGQRVGWAVRAVTEKGYSGKIELMIGLSPDGQKLTGLQILSASETPGLGDRIRGKDFRIERFRDKPADQPLAAVKADPVRETDVRALTGATISSNAVVQAVNDAMRQVQQAIAAQAGR